MKVILLSLLLITLLTSEVFPQTSNLNLQLQQIKNTYNVVGMSVCLIKHNSIVFSEGYGLRDIGRSLPVNDSTIYRIASISKVITAMTLMKLYEQGLVNFDTDISSYLGYILRNPYYPNDVITIRKILSHTASIRDGTGYNNFLTASYNNNPPPALQSLLVPGGSYYTADMFSSSKSPAENYFTYANINYGLIATLVEKISGVRFDLFCLNNIFIPLTVTTSFVINDLPNINNVAVLYRKISGNWIPQADNYNGVMPPPRNLTGYIIGSNAVIFSPQGGLRISGNDLSVIMRTLYNGGIFNGTRILNDSTVNLMLNPEWIYNGSNGNNYYGIFNTYGLGTHRTTDLLITDTLYGHPGEAYGLISDMYFSRYKNYGIIFITNGGQWGNGNYSGWYNIEEDVFQACYAHIDSFLVNTEKESVTLKEICFFRNFPNPFNPVTNIQFEISEKGAVKIEIFDVQGRFIQTLNYKTLEQGKHCVLWNAGNYPSGIYYCKLTVNKFSETMKLILLK